MTADTQLNDASENPYRDTFKTVGEIRHAAFILAMRLAESPLYDLAEELHDSLCRALPQKAETPVAEIRKREGFTP